MAGKALSITGFLMVLGIGFILYEPSFDPESLRGVRVLVTGCSTGLGEQIAYEYARLGAKVIITARRKKRLQEVVAKMKDLGAQEAHYVAGDMAKAKDCERSIKTALDKFGGLDVLVVNHLATRIENNAAELYWDGDMDGAEEFVQTNFLSYIRLASLALPSLNTSNGSIVVVGSLAGKVGLPGAALYSGIKSGLDGFFSVLQKELTLQKVNVSVTYAVLGFIDTTPGELVAKMLRLDNSPLFAPASTSEAARVVIKGGATRQTEVYYPWVSVWAMTKFFEMYRNLPVISNLLDITAL